MTASAASVSSGSSDGAPSAVSSGIVIGFYLRPRHMGAEKDILMPVNLYTTVRHVRGSARGDLSFVADEVAGRKNCRNDQCDQQQPEIADTEMEQIQILHFR